ncbi:MAG TPA: transglycosylase SLT domain-containing protein [Gallionellaceae bacterium]|jgi:hypothetical protein|nr:transglycosylase SLT domain-containing protein [Gallionellaceae bacterium]
MSNDIKINVKADADLGGINSALAEAAKSAETLSKSMSGGVLNIDTDKFNQQINQTTAALKVLHEKIQEKKQLGISTDTAEAQLKEFTQKKSDATKVLLGSQPGTGGKTPMEQSHQREQREIEKTQQAAKKLYKEISTAEADAINRSKHNLDTGRSPYAAYSKHHASFADLMQDGSPGAREATKRIMQNAGLHEAGARPKGGMSSQYGGKLAGAAIGMAGGMVAGGAGGDGMATAGSALGGMVGSIFGPVGSMIGGALGGLAGGVVGGGLGDAKDEAIGITDLRHSLGATTTDFTLLREAARAAASGMGMTSIESTRLAKQFSHNANTQSKDAGSLAAEIRLASGFSRSLGLDPSQGVEAMSTLRNTRATTDEAGSRKMAMTIAEAISKGGMGSKGDEVLSAIANFAQSTARASLQTPNVTGYADYMSRMVGTNTPGLDVQGTASLMGKADAGVRSHGDLGVETFKLGALMSVFGNKFSAMDQSLYTAGGMMSVPSVVAKDILNTKNLAPERRESAEQVLKSDYANRPILDSLMKKLASYGRGVGSSEYEQAGGRIFGMEQNEFRKFSQVFYGGGGESGKLQSQLQGYGIDTAKLDPAKFMHMATLLGSDRKDLTAEGEKLISGDGYNKNLSESESKHLRSTMSSGNDDALRQEIIKLQEGRSLIDDGEKSRKGIADVKQSVINLSSSLLPAVNEVRDAVLMFAKSDRDQLAAQQKKWTLDPQEREIKNKANAEVARLKAEHDAGRLSENERMKQTAGVRLREAADTAKLGADYDAKLAPQVESPSQVGDSPSVSADVLAGFDALKRGDIKGAKRYFAADRNRTAASRSAQSAQAISRPGLTTEMLKKLSESDAMLGLPGGMSYAQMMQESSGNPLANNGTAFGAFQITPQTQAGLEKKSGKKFNAFDFNDSLEMRNMLMKDLLKSSGGDVDEALRHYIGGGNKKNWGEHTMGYPDKVQGRMDSAFRPVAFSGGADAGQTITILLKYPNGQMATNAPIKVQIPAKVKSPSHKAVVA